MNQKQISLVQASFAEVVSIADAAAALFYDRLFELDPSLRPLFRGDMKEQGKKLMDMIAVVIVNLPRLTGILTSVRALGARHAAYGVRDEHYETVGEALLWTLGEALGEDFTDEMREAWATAYTILATAMKDAAAEAAA